MKFTSRVAFVIFLLLADSAFASMPRSWFTPDTAFSFENEDTKSLEVDLKNLVSVQSEGLESINFSKSTDWRLYGFAADLAVSASGLIGILGFGGSAFARVFWERKDGLAPPSSLHGRTNQLKLKGVVSESELNSQIDRLSEVVLATGRIENRNIFRTQLRNEIKTFYQRSQALSFFRNTSDFWASGFRLDLSVAGSGNIKGGTVGGEINIGLEWVRDYEDRLADFVFTQENDEIKNFILNMADVISQAASEENSFPGNVIFDKFGVGMGLTAAGNIGVAQFEGKIMGIVFFSPKPSGLKQNAYLVKEQVGDKIIHKMKLGIKKAIRMGRFVASEVMDVNSKNWRVSQVNTGFEVSMSGDVVFASLTGSVFAEIQFVNANPVKQLERVAGINSDVQLNLEIPKKTVEAFKPVGSFVEDELTKLANSPMELKTLTPFAYLFLNLKGRFGIEAPWLASLTINPEVEFIFSNSEN